MDSLSNRLHLFNCLGQLQANGANNHLNQNQNNQQQLDEMRAHLQQGNGTNLECKSFKQLLDAQAAVDCTLACSGGKISAHKVVLSACSSYLAKILAEHPVEHPIIILPELNIEDVRTLVHYMYTGELLKPNGAAAAAAPNSPHHSNSISLLRTAAILSINSLSDLLASTHALAAANLQHQHQHQQVQQQVQYAQQQHHNAFRPQLSSTASNSPPSSTASTNSQLQQASSSIVDHLAPLLTAINQHQQRQQQQQQQQISQDYQKTSGELNVTKNHYDAQQHLFWNQVGQQQQQHQLNLAGLTPASMVAAAAAAQTAAAAAAAATASSLNSSSSLIPNLPPSAPPSVSSGLSSASSAASLTSCLSAAASPQQQQQQQTSFGLQTKQQHYAEMNCNKQQQQQLMSHLPAAASAQMSGGGGGGNGTPNGTNEFQFKCPVCQNNFQTICSFEYHMQRIHNVTSFGCEICHKPFASLRYVLTDHMRRCHGWKGPTPATNNKREQQQADAAKQQTNNKQVGPA